MAHLDLPFSARAEFPHGILRCSDALGINALLTYDLVHGLLAAATRDYSAYRIVMGHELRSLFVRRRFVVRAAEVFVHHTRSAMMAIDPNAKAAIRSRLRGYATPVGSPPDPRFADPATWDISALVAQSGSDAPYVSIALAALFLSKQDEAFALL